MYTFQVSALCGCLCLFSVYSQQDPTYGILRDIEQNNTELKAFRSLIESRVLANKSGNNLPDPQLSAYYLPYGENPGREYTEYQISQTVEFPTVYAARGKWNMLQSEQLESDYEKSRQDVLLKAKKLLVDYLISGRQLELENLRREQGKKVYDQIEELYNKEQLGILDLNKAKIAWLQQQFTTDQIRVDIGSIQAELKKLNGGQPLDLGNTTLGDSLEIESAEAIWQDKLARDPELQNLMIEESVSLQKIRLEENKALPDLTAGYNYQGVSGNNFSGFYGGISIPLWNSRNKVKAAEAEYQFRQSRKEEATASLYTLFQKRYNHYQLLLEKYREYQATMKSLESEELLSKAFELGELSYMEYYMELRFYREALDRMLDLEQELYQLKAELLKHQL